VGEPYVGEIRIVGFNFAPQGWSFANGALVSISQNPTLFDLIGTTYGGDGQQTFALPNVQSRMPMHQGAGRFLGQTGGAEATTFAEAYIPVDPQPPIPTLNSPTAPLVQPLVAFHHPEQLSTISPFLVLNFIISFFGVFPSQG
jgi:microcystin-dependent protein